MPLCEPISDEEMEKLRAEARAKMEKAYGPIPNDSEDEEDGTPFQLVGSAEAADLAAEEANEIAADAEDAEELGV